MIISSTSSVSESSIFAFLFVRQSFWLISICKIHYHTDIERSLCLPVCFWFYQLSLCCVQSVIQLPYLSLWYWYLLISNIHFVCLYDFVLINLVCVQSVIQLLNLSLWYWYLLISNVHFVCQYDFDFNDLVCVQSVIQLLYLSLWY